MSNKKLENATIGDFMGPLFPTAMEKFQEMYKVGRFSHFPITEAFLKEFTNKLGFPFFTREKFNPDFVTQDGSHWYGVRVGLPPVDYYILFPKGRDRAHLDDTVSDCHVALYLDSTKVPVDDIVKVAQAFFSIFDSVRKDYAVTHKKQH